MSVSTEDRQRIFLAYRALFEGQDALVRKPKTIKKKILDSSQATSSRLISRLGSDKVTLVLKELLEADVFSSDLKAKLAFPVLFETSPEQEARHEASDVGAARVEAEVLHEIEALDSAAASRVENEEIEEEWNDPAASKVDRDRSAEAEDTVPSLYPVHFPFGVQHSIITAVQGLLEKSCYDFTKQHAPNLLTIKEWDCAEAVELNKWSFDFHRGFMKSPAAVVDGADIDISELWSSVIMIRHAAVHRVRISAKGLLQMVETAVKFAEVLSDHVGASQLEELCKELRSKIKGQELNKNFLEIRLKKELEAIEQERKALEKREEDAIALAVNEDKEQMCFAGSVLESDLRRILEGEHVDAKAESDDPDDQFEHAKEPDLVDDVEESKEANEVGSQRSAKSEPQVEERVDGTHDSVGVNGVGSSTEGYPFRGRRQRKFLRWPDSSDVVDAEAEEDTNDAVAREYLPENGDRPIRRPPMGAAREPGEPSVTAAWDEIEALPERAQSSISSPPNHSPKISLISETIQRLLKNQNIDPIELPQLQHSGSNGKKKTLQRRAYESKMRQVEEGVLRALREGLENVRKSSPSHVQSGAG